MDRKSHIFTVYKPIDYCSRDPGSPDPHCGKPLESEDTCDFGINFISRSTEVVSLPSDQKQKSRNCIQFADVNYLILAVNVDSRELKIDSTQNQRN